MNNEVLEYLKKLIEKKYGGLTDETGCYVNGEWLSVADIIQLINRAAKEC